MAASVGDLVINLSANIASLVVGMDRAREIVNNTAKQMTDAFDFVKKTLATIGVGVTFGALVSSIKSVIDYADRLNDLSKTTGIAVETLGGLGYAAKQSGVDLDTVAKGVQKLAQNMSQVAGGGNNELLGLFQKMGVSIRDLNTGALRPLDQVLFDVADKFKTYADGPEKAALATELFKKGGEALIPLLDEGGEKIRALVEEYKQYGGVSADTAARADEFNDTLEKVHLIQGALFREIASALLPTLQAIANVFLDAKNKGESFSLVAGGITGVVKGLAIVGVVVAQVFDHMGKSLGAVGAMVAAFFSGEWSRIPKINEEAGKEIQDGWTKTIQQVSTIWNAGTETIAVASERNLGERAVAPVKKVAQVAKDLTSSLNAYLKSLADIELAYAATLARSQAQGFEIAQEATKRQYAEGVIDFQTYYQKLNEIQRTSIDSQIQEAQRQVDIQSGLVDGLQKTLDNLKFDPNKYKTYAQFQADQYKAQTALNEATAKLIDKQGTLNDLIAKANELGKDYIEAFLVPASNGLLKYVSDLDKQITQLERQNEEIGLTAAQVAELNVQRVEEARINAVLAGAGDDVIAFYDRQLDRLRKISDLTNEGDFKQKWIDGWRDLFQSAADRGAQFIEDFVQHGSSAFKNLWNDFKSYALATLAKIAAQQIIVSIAGSFGLGSIAQNAFGQSFNPLQLLSGASSAASLGNTAAGGGSILSSGGNILAGLDNLPTTLAGLPAFSTAVSNLATIAPTFSAAIESGAGVAEAASAAFAGTAASFATVAIPVAGVVIAALFASGVFDHKPSPVKGQFQISPGTTGFEDNAYTASSAGNLGFADVNTQQFSGQAAQVFNQIVGGAIDAFAARYTPDQRAHLTQVLQSTTFPTFEGTFTTEDFIKQYGGQVLQQVIVAAFGELDPALAAVAQGFSGTADEVAKFGNTLLSIYDATKAIGDSNFTAGIDQALEGANQKTADEVAAFVNVANSFGATIVGLRDALKGVDPSKITGLVEAFGGADAFVQTFATFNQNFGTNADQAANATTRLTDVFGSLGIEVPQTHAQFVKIVDDLIAAGNTDAAQAILAVSDAFVTLHGTAQQAADALNQAAQSGRDYYSQHFLTPSEQLAQRQGADETSLYDLSKPGTLVNDVLTALNLQIPTTVDGVRQLVNATIAKYGADSDEAKAIFALIPIIGDLIDSVGGFGDAATTAADQVGAASSAIIVSVGSIIQATNDLKQAGADAANKLLSSIQDLAGQSTGSFGEQLATQIGLIESAIQKTGAALTGGGVTTVHQRQADGTVVDHTITQPLRYTVPGGDVQQQAYVDTLAAQNTKLVDQLRRFNELTVQYGDDIAKQLVDLQDWRTSQYQIFAGMPDDLAVVDEIFQQKWQAIITGSSAAAQSLDDFIKSIENIASSTQGNAGQQAALELALSGAKLADLQTKFAAALPGSALAKSIQSDIDKLSTYNAGLAQQIANFAIYKAQYGEDVANQLVDLQNQFDQWKDQVGGNADALAVLTDIFNERWQKIIDGTKNGVSDTLDQLNKLKQGIGDYLKGLAISDVSPLTPTEKLAAAHDAFYSDLSKAQAGDLDALGKITQDADAYLKTASDFYASAPAFHEIFDAVTGVLGTLADTTPGGLPLPNNASASDNAVDALEQSLPDGKLASQSDIKENTDALREFQALMVELFGAHAATTTAATQETTAAVQELATATRRRAVAAK